MVGKVWFIDLQPPKESNDIAEKKYTNDLILHIANSKHKSINSSFFSLQVFDVGRYQESLAAYFALGQHQHINQILEILLGETRAYVFFERSYGDMHSFVRTCKKLREDEAARLFYQIASAVAHCHDNGLVLRDLKLRKFVFKNEDR